MVKIDKEILKLLGESGPLTLAEIAETLDVKPKAVFRALRRLFEKEQITRAPNSNRYTLGK